MIDVKDITFNYRGGEFSLAVPEFSVSRGETVALSGPSGTGKTTLLNLMAGILVPESGSIEIDDLDIATLAVEDRQDFRAARMGLMFQEFGLLDYLNVLENICLPYRITPILELNAEVLERGCLLAEEIGLGDKLKRHPRHLSQGERQRIELCRALVTKPSVVFGDEPTGNLDPDNRDRVIEILFRYAAEHEAPVVIVTHDHELLDRFDRVVDIRELGS